MKKVQFWIALSQSKVPNNRHPKTQWGFTHTQTLIAEGWNNPTESINTMKSLLPLFGYFFCARIISEVFFFSNTCPVAIRTHLVCYLSKFVFEYVLRSIYIRFPFSISIVLDSVYGFLIPANTLFENH